MLSARGVRFELRDLSVDEEAVEFLRANEIRAVPVIRAGPEIIIGFDEARLKQVLGLVGASEAFTVTAQATGSPMWRTCIHT